jgi:ABC-2 type transport system permease protein
MHTAARYLRLILALSRFGIARELAFRSNFVVKVLVEVLWLCILLAFYRTVFSKTTAVAGWSEAEYLFFVGTYFALAGLIEALFLSNCNEFADLIRTGDLDIYLLMPIDEQFLVTCRNIDWSAASNVVTGGAVMSLALYQLNWAFDAGKLLLFAGLFVCGIAIAYSLLVILTSTSVWLKRNQSLYEMWWLFTSLMRYPRELFQGPLATPLGNFFWYIVPVLLVINIPARFLVRVIEPWSIAFMAVAAVVLLFASRWFFRYALRRYRSASS